jgi:DDE superfamily endonuclease
VVAPRRSVVLAEDETHLNLLPHVRVSWTLGTAGPQIPTPGTNRQVTVFGALELSTGRCVYRLGRRCAADFIAQLDQLLRAFPRAPVIVVICDNDSIHHACKVTAYLDKHPRLELLYGARHSPHDNPAERIWAALKNYVANTAVSWPARLRQIHSFLRNRSPGQMLATAAPWTSPWLPPRAELLECRFLVESVMEAKAGQQDAGHGVGGLPCGVSGVDEGAVDLKVDEAAHDHDLRRGDVELQTRGNELAQHPVAASDALGEDLELVGVA